MHDFLPSRDNLGMTWTTAVYRVRDLLRRIFSEGLARQYDIDSLDNRKPEVIDAVYRLLHRPLETYFRFKVSGLERIPPGPGLFVANHNAGMLTLDSFIFAVALYHARGLADFPYGLGHEIAIRLPLIHQLIMPLGVVRASYENASRLFSRGEKVIVYPGGDIEAMRPYRHRNRICFGGRRGYIRLALCEKIPIIPVVAAGSHETLIILDDLTWLVRWLKLDRCLRINAWPISLAIPWGLMLGPPLIYLPYPSRILIEILDPIRLEPAGPSAAEDEAYVRRCADEVEAIMQASLERLARERRALNRDSAGPIQP